ncbi:peptidoglycan DD-metalloendopeptidase family protein [Pigmentiphaga soli]|uniref:Peptidoglycan DD-metalloendopeptidase family protein n=1 Tax=Pigmentiphaga soli TaxID=1007095 RepID=A0ABP8H7I4_9BURK
MLNGPKPSLIEADGAAPRRAAVPLRRVRAGALAALAALLLAACGSTPPRTVPVVDRTTPVRPSPSTPPAATAGREAIQPVDGDTYVVKRGDTLYQIALDHGQDWRDIAQWNNLTDPNHLLVGQQLKVARPSAGARPADASVAQVAPVPGPAASAPRPLDEQAPPAASTPAPGDQAAAPSPTRSIPVKPDAPGDKVDWAWPASGKVIETFNESRNKGLDIAGTPGDPVLAAGDGKVVYSGNGLRGYGNLIIIKHNNVYLSAYAHNRAMLVKEGQSVRRGQKIAELGQTDTDSPRLHFEIRRQGRPVDPSAYLPQR